MVIRLVLIGLSVLLYQDPGQDGPMVTAPAPIIVDIQAVTPPPAPTQLAPPLGDALPPPARRAEPPGGEDEFSRAFAESRTQAASPVAQTRALPPEALSDPVAYAAQQCRPGSRPTDEDIEACFTRIENQIRDARRAQDAARAPRTTCRQQVVRSEDGRSVSTESSCTIGSGDILPTSILFGD
jgi:hypothetical protein